MEASSETAQDVLVEEGDVVTMVCACENCRDMDVDDLDKAHILILEIGDDQKILPSPVGRLQPTDDNMYLDGNGGIFVEGGGERDLFKIVDVQKGAGTELVQIYRKYKQLLEKHIASGIDNEQFEGIWEQCDKETAALLDLIPKERAGSNKYIVMSMLFDVLGIEADERQITLASRIVSYYMGLAGEVLMKAKMAELRGALGGIGSPMGGGMVIMGPGMSPMDGEGMGFGMMPPDSKDNRDLND
ncbi:MAG: hypothetical protein Q7S53_02520 [bacterium]|nr:hypothetical protein [bacterium]